MRRTTTRGTTSLAMTTKGSTSPRFRITGRRSSCDRTYEQPAKRSFRRSSCISRDGGTRCPDPRALRPDGVIPTVEPRGGTVGGTTRQRGSIRGQLPARATVACSWATTSASRTRGRMAGVLQCRTCTCGCCRAPAVLGTDRRTSLCHGYSLRRSGGPGSAAWCRRRMRHMSHSSSRLALRHDIAS